MIQVDLTTYGKDLQDAYNKVLDGDSEIQWTIMVYDRNTPSLKILKTGAGLEQLSRSFDEGRVQYVFLRVIEEFSKISKFVFISWCGEGVPEKAKGMLAAHLEAVKERFNGFHVHISARSEHDVEPKQIIHRLKDSTGSFHVHRDSETRRNPTETKQSFLSNSTSVTPPILSSQPRSPTIKNTASKQSINASTQPHLSSFVQNQIQPQKKIVPEKNKEEMQTKQHTDSPLLTEREKRMKELEELRTKSHAAPYARNNSSSDHVDTTPIRKIVYQETKIASLNDRKQAFETPSESDSGESPSIVRRQWQQREVTQKPAVSAQSKIGLESVSGKNNYVDNQRSIVPEISTVQSSSSQQSFSDAKSNIDFKSKLSAFESSVKSPSTNRNDFRSDVIQNTISKTAPTVENSPVQTKNTVYNDIPKSKSPVSESLGKNQSQRNSGLVGIREQVYEIPTSTLSSQIAIGLYDYEANDDNELSFRAGEKIQQIEKSHEGWWQGMNEKGEVGFFPSNFVELQSTEFANNVADKLKHNVDSSVRAKVLYEYVAADDSELGLQEGDFITEIEQLDDGWWRGYDKNGNFGLFPANFVELV